LRSPPGISLGIELLRIGLLELATQGCLLESGYQFLQPFDLRILADFTRFALRSASPSGQQYRPADRPRPGMSQGHHAAPDVWRAETCPPPAFIGITRPLPSCRSA
jgi:hypothetical protein